MSKKKTNDFEKMSILSKEKNPPKVFMVPLKNIKSIKEMKKSGEITLGMEPGLATRIVNNEFTGGLYLIDREAFKKLTKDEETHSEIK